MSWVQLSTFLRKQLVTPQGGEPTTDDLKSMLADSDRMVEEIFVHEDKDKNGFISYEEFSGPKHDEL